ncbi:MAG: ABC transporter ATP-binding protein [Bdellovibrionales bacterium]|nr:ABC transporter ATP-binding protein [Bdellovibrionales bacterium]
MMGQVRLEQLQKIFENAGRELHVIENLNYTFPEQGSVAIVGRSGIGKSTLLHLIGGLESPSGGKIYYGETEITSLSSEKRSRFRGERVGFIFQFHHLLPEFNALENVAMPLLIGGLSSSEAEERAADVLAKVGLRERVLHRPNQLSGGEQQRVAIARAIATEPSVILADEPTGNLDLKTGLVIQELLLQVISEQKSMLIVVTHSLELAGSLDMRLEMHPGGALIPF